MILALTGATGFTGSYVVPELIKMGARLRCLVRSSSDIRRLSNENIELIYGDMGNEKSVRRLLDGADALVNVASIGFGHAPVIVNAATASNLDRAIFIGSTAIFTALNAASKRVRRAAEETISKSGLAYTILRPTMIYGDHRDRNISRLVRFIHRSPVIPVFGPGTFHQQPVHVRDVADAVVRVLKTDATVRRTYNIPGADPINFNRMCDIIGGLLGRRKPLLHLPDKPVIDLLRLCEGMGLILPIKAEQVMRLNEHKRFSYLSAAEDFGYAPRSFDTGVSAEIDVMRRRRII
ncbi:hypothetical protein D3OALGA1CA_393 [Olavius algarvensis associated proteobacterium Delta 3]|nr:hypothetical protein D3OALGA1CA_393 [Olavius algarvensis associated proteobacterium Delta 3]CAB5113618.1 hypothetical protein D3OALGB2SA_2535 [Olavius algarvensis associated proteobacterium Delta 3]